MTRAPTTALLLLALAAGAARGQSPPDWRTAQAWQDLAARWAQEPRSLRGAALVRVGWEAALDPAARAACAVAAELHVVRVPHVALTPSARALLAALALADVREPPSFEAPEDEAALAALLAERPATPLEAARRTLRLLARVDRPDGAELLARLRDASPTLDPGLEALVGTADVRRRLDALARLEEAVGDPDPLPVEWKVEEPFEEIARGGPPSPRTTTPLRGQLVGAEAAGCWVIDDLGWLVRLSSARTRPRRVDPLDDGLSLLLGTTHAGRLRRLDARLVDQAVPIQLWRRRGEALVRVAAVRACDRRGQGWLAHALASGPIAWDVREDVVVRGRLSDVTRRFLDGAPAAEARALLAPLAGRGSARVRSQVRELEAGLVEGSPVRAVTWAEWQALGLDERLELLEAALAGHDLSAPFPADAPLLPEGPPTVWTHLRALGWSALPLLARHVEDSRCTRGLAPGATVGTEARQLFSVRMWLDEQRWIAEDRAATWWAEASAQGPARWWRAHIEGKVRRSTDDQDEAAVAEAVVHDLGPAATPWVVTRLRYASGRDRAAWLGAAATLREPSLRPTFEAALAGPGLPVVVAGAVGLHGLGEPTALARLEEIVRVALGGRFTEVASAVEALRRVDPPAATALARTLSGPLALGRETEAMLRAVGVTEVDGRLALCRCLARAFGLASVEPAGALDGDAVPLRELAVRCGLPRTAAPLDVVVEALVRDAPAWRDDEVRREHALRTALLLGEGPAADVARRAGADLRHARAVPSTRAVVRVAAVEVDDSVPPAIAEQARALAGHDAGEAELVDLVRAWRRAVAVSVRLSLARSTGWSDPTLRLARGDGRSELRIVRRRAPPPVDVTMVDDAVRSLLREMIDRPGAVTDASLTLAAP